MPKICKHFEDIMFGLAPKNGEGSTGMGTAGRAYWSEGKAKSQRLTRTRGRKRFPLEGRSKVAKACVRLSRMGRLPPFSATLSVCDVCEFVSVFEERSQAPLQWVKIDRIE